MVIHDKPHNALASILASKIHTEGAGQQKFLDRQAQGSCLLGCFGIFLFLINVLPLYRSKHIEGFFY